MRPLPEICQRQSDCHVLIVGGADISYGRKLDNGLNYREKLLQKIGFGQNRVHFWVSCHIQTTQAY